MTQLSHSWGHARQYPVSTTLVAMRGFVSSHLEVAPDEELARHDGQWVENTTFGKMDSTSVGRKNIAVQESREAEVKW